MQPTKLTPAKFCNKHNIVKPELEITLKKYSSGKTHIKKVEIRLDKLISLNESRIKRAKKNSAELTQTKKPAPIIL